HRLGRPPTGPRQPALQECTARRLGRLPAKPALDEAEGHGDGPGHSLLTAYRPPAPVRPLHAAQDRPVGTGLPAGGSATRRVPGGAPARCLGDGRRSPGLRRDSRAGLRLAGVGVPAAAPAPVPEGGGPGAGRPAATGLAAAPPGADLAALRRRPRPVP